MNTFTKKKLNMHFILIYLFLSIILVIIYSLNIFSSNDVGLVFNLKKAIKIGNVLAYYKYNFVSLVFFTTLLFSC